MKKVISIITILSMAWTPFGYSAIPTQQSRLDSIETDDNPKQVVFAALLDRGDDDFCVVNTANRLDLVPHFVEVAGSSKVSTANDMFANHPACEPDEVAIIQGVAENAVEGPVQVALGPAVAFWFPLAAACTLGAVMGKVATEMKKITTKKRKEFGDYLMLEAGAAGFMGGSAATALTIEVLTSSVTAAEAATISTTIVKSGLIGLGSMVWTQVGITCGTVTYFFTRMPSEESSKPLRNHIRRNIHENKSELLNLK